MYKVSDNTMIFCPYDRGHVVSKLRIQSHIVKCKKNHPEMKLATCFYNYTHRLKPEDMLKHYEICTHKARMDGTREHERSNFPFANASVKRDPCTKNFPDINVKPKIFYSTPEYSTSLQSESDCNPKGDYCGSECKSDNIELEATNDNQEKWLSDKDESDDELEPLPLPKTVSKAFVCIKKSEVPSAGFGRGKNFLKFLPKSSKASDDALTNLNSMKIPESSRIKNSTFAATPKSYSTSVSSSMLDDEITLKSDDIIFDDDDTSNEDDSGIKFISKNMDQHVKI